MMQLANAKIADLARFESIQREALDVFSASDLYKSPEQLLDLVAYEHGEIMRRTSASGRGAVFIYIRFLRGCLINVASYAFAAVTEIDNKQNYDGYQEVLAEARDLFVSKNRDYGDSYKEFGSVGVIIRLVDKINRLRQIMGEQHKLNITDEPPRSTWLDLGNYAVMAVLLIDQVK